ncbi:biopolymer transport protein ExbD [Selenomonas ruminantium]|uniref:Biopolymer transport protein ExbD n=1 Tax=Selenomonas ruminantium TaxID=971 RepID=A0A1I3GH03_SELRU|nr:biopolymer transporter ExbD [Selenomonas ruminantium]SFI22707.1 biopolymer transport protein ExbD [Selenomonas ruminantium]
MRLRDRRAGSQPEVMIIPMIDIMFFLLVFFMMSTLYMVNLKTVDVEMPKAQHAETQMNVNYLVTLKQDGSLWLEDELVAEQDLLERAKQEYKRNPRFAVVVRADQNIDYGLVVALLDKLRGAGIARFGLAAEPGGTHGE